jgi:hypothetical protein
MAHFITKCKECDTVINQCRCPSLNKVTKYDTCTNCKAAAFDIVTPGERQLLREAKAREIYLRHQISKLEEQVQQLENKNAK